MFVSCLALSNLVAAGLLFVFLLSFLVDVWRTVASSVSLGRTGPRNGLFSSPLWRVF